MDSTTMAIRFDKARYIKTLRDAGQSQESAEAFADALDVAMAESSSSLATKQDLFELKSELLQKMNQGENVFMQTINRQTITIIGIVVTLFGLLVAAKFIS